MGWDLNCGLSYNLRLPIKGSSEKIKEQIKNIFKHFEKMDDIFITVNGKCIHMGITREYCENYEHSYERYERNFEDNEDIDTTTFSNNKLYDENFEYRIVCQDYFSSYKGGEEVIPRFPYEKLKMIIDYFKLDWSQIEMSAKLYIN